jgi:hypothetical protein
MGCATQVYMHMAIVHAALSQIAEGSDTIQQVILLAVQFFCLCYKMPALTLLLSQYCL